MSELSENPKTCSRYAAHFTPIKVEVASIAYQLRMQAAPNRIRASGIFFRGDISFTSLYFKQEKLV